MKLKKILALACSLVMASSMFVATANAAVEGCTATLEFAGYETKGAATFAKINVKATIPDTLVPYEMIPADWENTFEDSYKGVMLQSVEFTVPYVDGLQYVGSLSTVAEYAQIQDNKTDSQVSVYAANTGSYDTYYAGEVGDVATLYYRITGDAAAAYDVAFSNVVIGLVSVAESGSVTPKEYTFKDFAVTNTTVKPAAAKLTAEVADITGAGVTAGKAWKVSGTTDGTNAVTGLDVKFVSGKDSLEKSVKDMPEITGATYEINVGLLTQKTIDSASFTVADAADATATATWNK